MDGAKSITDTTDSFRASGRQAFCMGRNFSVRSDGPYRNENPGVSRILAECDSLSLKGQGFLGNVDQPRVSWS